MKTFVLDNTQDRQVIDLTNKELRKVIQKVSLYSLSFAVLAILSYFLNAYAIIAIAFSMLAARYIYKGIVGIQQMEVELGENLINEASIQAFQDYYQRR